MAQKIADHHLSHPVGECDTCTRSRTFLDLSVRLVGDAAPENGCHKGADVAGVRDSHAPHHLHPDTVTRPTCSVIQCSTYIQTSNTSALRYRLD